MDRGSDLHGARLDEELAREVEPLTRGEPIEARAEDERVIEEGYDEIVLEDHAPTPPGQLSQAEIRARSELAWHLRPSVFPADRYALVECAIEERADPELLEQLAHLDAKRQFATVQQVWEALGGSREGAAEEPVVVHRPLSERPTSHRPAVVRFLFRWDRAYQLAALPLAITPGRTSVEIDTANARLIARFGRWTVDTALTNIIDATITGPYAVPKTIGPPHLSLSDRGLTFASNNDRGVCIRFRAPVRGIDPLGVIRHPGLTVTVAEPERLRDVLS